MASAPVSSFDGGPFTTCKQNKPFLLPALLVSAFITATKSKEGGNWCRSKGCAGMAMLEGLWSCGQAVGCSQLSELSEASQQAALPGSPPQFLSPGSCLELLAFYGDKL